MSFEQTGGMFNLESKLPQTIWSKKTKTVVFEAIKKDIFSTERHTYIEATRVRL